MSISQPEVPRRLSTDQFLRWLETRAEGERWELVDGEPVRSMSPETVRHVELKRNLLEALRDALRTAGLPCRALGDGVAVRVDPRSFFQPDASVTCAERVDPDAVEVPNPIVVAEVVSPGTRVRDHTVKLVDYFAVPSVQHYLLMRPAADWSSTTRCRSRTARRCASPCPGSTASSRQVDRPLHLHRSAAQNLLGDHPGCGIRVLGERQPGGAASALEPGERARARHRRARADPAVQWLRRVRRRPPTAASTASACRLTFDGRSGPV